MDAQYAPQRFGRYVLLDRMGVGGMAEVFRAVVPGAEGFRRDLVVKRILSDRACAANFIEMFGHEARISALLHHPNVVQVFDFGQVDGSYFLAMELLRGRDLLAIFRSLRERQQPFPIPIAAYVAHQVALGLGYAHALTSPDGQPLNIIHRDVSPANIMCLRAGGVKLLDFGIAQAIGEMDSDVSERSSFKGRLCYMAPERLRDEPQDGRVDLFSLGAVLWETLTARRLFHGATEIEKLRSVLEKPIPPPSAFRPEVPARLDQIVLKMLARDPNERYATGQALADDLEVVVGETKYQSRMMPAFLAQLFGSAPSSAHMALSMASPEMLAFNPTVASPITVAPIATPATTAALVAAAASTSTTGLSRRGTLGIFPRAMQRLRALKTGAKVAIAVGTVASLGAIAWASAGLRHATGQRMTRVVPATSSAPSPRLPPPAVPAFVRTDSPVATGGETVAAAAPRASGLRENAESDGPASASARAVLRAPAHPGRPAVTKATGHSGVGRITRGLSIDPFAEAATRGARR
jgi:serine/threonine protein kinase